ncbi:hypothetical protein CO725_01030 [Vibrio parahaemolyticus]|uniref:hypothetical protein n=1 Tax=Vibrio parahaemolyticus TaxID=670 RepID=UPI000BE32B16|nr:hypothetical protein [Vibrio parahaemolyticus]ATI44270.1 hypothetical protein CO725_01030 [Vibrio parahaemolyticus]
MNIGKGYDGYSKSINAIEAEDSGKFPLTEIKKRTKLQSETIKEFFTPCEWHHTSKQYNKTHYYDLSEIESGITEQVLDFDKQLKAKKRLDKGQTFKGCEVEWSEWINKKRYDYKEENCTVHVKGKKHTIITSTGYQFVKMKDSNGFKFKTATELKVIKEQIREWKSLQRTRKANFNKDLNLLLSEKGKQLYVIDYHGNFIRDPYGLGKSHFEPVDYDLMTKKDFKLNLKAEYERSGLEFIERTIKECTESGFSRLGRNQLVMWTNDPDAMLDAMEEKLCIDVIDFHIKEYGNYENMPDEYYNEIKDRTLKRDDDAVRHFNEYVHNKEASACLERLKAKRGDEPEIKKVSNRQRLRA